MNPSVGLRALACSLPFIAACLQSPRDDEADAAGGAAGTAAAGASAGQSGSAAGPLPVVGDEVTSCAGVESQVTLVVSADVKQDTTWSGTVLVARPLSVTNAATLTIAAGTQVVMAADTWLMVGDKLAGGALQAQGAADAPITFCGKQRQRGYWGGVGFGRYSRSDSVLSHVVLRDAGGGDAALLLDGSVHARDVSVLDSAHDGVWASVFASDSERLSVQGSVGAAVVLLTPQAVSSFPLGGVLSGNGEDLLRVRFGTIDEATRFRSAGLPYLLEGGLLVRGGARLAFEAGVEVRFAADTALDVGVGNHAAELVVQGTAEQPVLLRGAASTPGFWQGIGLGSRALTSSRLEHVQIRDAGGKERAALFVDSAATLMGVSLQANARGAFIGPSGLQPESAGLGITGTQGPPLTVAPDALVSLPAQGTFTGNATDQIVVEGGAYTRQGVLANHGVPYLLAATVSLQNASELTIAPGTQILMGPNASLEVGARATSTKLVARGTAALPIEFSGQAPTAGSWGAIVIYAAATSDSLFDYVRVSHGGGGNPKSGDLVLSKAFAVTNSSFSKSFGHGIVKWKGDPTDYTVSNSFADNASAPVGAY